MNKNTKQMLDSAYQWCEDNKKSTEFMLEYLQDVSGADLDMVINYLQKYH